MIGEAHTEQASLSSHRRFAVMDGLRGIAALAVVALHSAKDSGWFLNGQIAVDFFFIMSGFVVAFSYEEKLKRAMTPRDFLKARFVRLYPMLFIGALGGIFIAFIHYKTHPGETTLAPILISGFLSLFVIPYFSPAPFGDKIFSFNPPIWSLFFEALANLVYAFLGPRLRKSHLAVIVIISLAAVVIIGPVGGNRISNFLSGVPRVSVGFFGGVLLFKLWRERHFSRIRGNLLLLSAIILAIFFMPVEIGGWLFAPTFAALCCVVIAAANAMPSKLDRYSEFLGFASYPIYLIHWVTLYFANWLGFMTGLSANFYWILAIAHCAAMPYVGYLVARFYETRARLWLKNRLL